MREQKHHVDRTGGDKSGYQHCVHRGLQNRPRSMNETQVKSPKVCFSADSYLVYGIWRDSRRRVSAMASPNEQGPCGGQAQDVAPLIRAAAASLLRPTHCEY